jgi:hypothetical protein
VTSKRRSRIAALLRTNLANILVFGIPKDFWSLLRLWPTAFLAVVSYLWEPSDRGIRLILLALLWDLAIQFWLLVSTMKRPENDLLATVARLQDCTYTPISWDRVMKRDDAAAAERAAIVERTSMINTLRRWGLNSSDHSGHARFFLVGMGESGGMPGGLGVYNIPFMEAVILLRDDPAEAEVKERFCLYHELGHTLGDEFISQAGLEQGVKHPFTALVLAALAIHVTTASILVMAASLVGLWIIRLLFDRRRKSLRATSEMKADQFAIQFLDDQDREHVLQDVESVLPEDSDLSPLEHLARVDAARTFIKTRVPIEKRDPSAARLPYFGETQLVSLNLCAWMVLLAGFIGAPSARLVHDFQWLIGAVIALGVLRYAIRYWKSIVLELILIQRVTWQNGKFQIRRGPSHAPALLP